MVTFVSYYPRIRIDTVLQGLVNRTNKKMNVVMKELGISYVPFLLELDTKLAKTDSYYKRPVKTVRIDINQDFLSKYFERKISFEQWLSKNHNKVARAHYRYINNMEPVDHEHIDMLFKRYKQQVPIGDRSPTFERQTRKTSSVMAHVKESNPNTAGHVWEGYTGADIDKFIENEQYLFSDNMRIFFTHQDESGTIRKVLEDVLKEFRQEFMSMDFTKIAYDEKGAITENDDDKEWLNDIYGQEQSWKQKTIPKFPNISNIKEWFLRKGMYKSTKIDQFNQIKTVKGRMNWIDRSVFLLANGVYAKSLGQSTTFASGKVKQTAGAKVSMSHARRYKRFSKDREKYNTKRQQNLAEWKIDNRRIAAGWDNRSTAYSRVNRKKGNSSRMDKREDNRV